MSLLDQTSVLILTYNEAPNLARTLQPLSGFRDVVVLDSGSTDGTLDIVAAAPNARALHRPFDTHAAQWNHGLSGCGITSEWVLALDADYVLGPQVIAEIAALQPAAEVAGYRLSFRYCIHGRPLSGTLYPPVIALYRRARARYVQAGHTQRLDLEGTIGHLVHKADHDDRKPLARWLQSQQAYARLEAAHLLGAEPGDLRVSDRVRRMMVPAPFLVFFYTLIAKRCILDGWRGWFYVLQRVLAEALIALELLDGRLQRLKKGQPRL